MNLERELHKILLETFPHEATGLSELGFSSADPLYELKTDTHQITFIRNIHSFNIRWYNYEIVVRDHTITGGIEAEHVVEFARQLITTIDKAAEILTLLIQDPKIREVTIPECGISYRAGNVEIYYTYRYKLVSQYDGENPLDDYQDEFGRKNGFYVRPEDLVKPSQQIIDEKMRNS